MSAKAVVILLALVGFAFFLLAGFGAHAFGLSTTAELAVGGVADSAAIVVAAAAGG